jgi:phosphoglycolate phosphatase
MSPTARSPFPASTLRSTPLKRRAAVSRSAPTKLEELSRQLLKVLRLTHRFDAICGPDTFRIQKPDPDFLVRTIEAANGHPRHAVMVGDSGTDIATARAAGIPIVAVDFGYSETPVAELKPDRLISHFDQLAAAVMELAAKLS